ncbi:MAG: aldo/keto reductase, partial [Rubrobacteraceae bacterium]
AGRNRASRRKDRPDHLQHLPPETSRRVLPLAEERNVGVLARVLLASGLLSGKMTAERVFSDDDHRSFNREGEAFDQGEIFSGVPFETGLAAAEELKDLPPEGYTLAQFALRWILMHPGVTCAIPGAKSPSQAEDNAAAVLMPTLPDETMQRVSEVYDRYIRESVHVRW